MTESEQVLDGAARPGDVVDVDALDGDVRAASPGGRPGSRRGPARGATDRPTRGPDTIRPSACWARRSALYEVVAAVGLEQLDHHPEAAGAGRRGQAAERLGQDRVAGDLLGRLVEDEGDDVAPTAGQLAGRRVGRVAELLGGIHHPLAGLGGDLDVGAPVEDERDRRPRDAGPRGHIGAGGTFRHRAPAGLRESGIDVGALMCGTVTRVSNAYQ